MRMAAIVELVEEFERDVAPTHDAEHRHGGQCLRQQDEHGEDWRARKRMSSIENGRDDEPEDLLRLDERLEHVRIEDENAGGLDAESLEFLVAKAIDVPVEGIDDGAAVERW